MLKCHKTILNRMMFKYSTALVIEHIRFELYKWGLKTIEWFGLYLCEMTVINGLRVTIFSDLYLHIGVRRFQFVVEPRTISAPILRTFNLYFDTLTYIIVIVN